MSVASDSRSFHRDVNISAAVQDTPSTAHRSPTHSSLDWQLIILLATVSAILLIQTILAIAWVCIHHQRSILRWARLRERGIVIVNGPELIYAENLPTHKGISYINLRQPPHASRSNVTVTKEAV